MNDFISDINAIYDRIGLGGSSSRGLNFETGEALALRLGYNGELLARVPQGNLASFVGADALPRIFAELGLGGPVADLGAGAGVDALTYALMGHKVAALDLSIEMLKRLDGGAFELGLKCRIAGVRALLPHIPLASEGFGAACMNGSANIVADKDGLLAQIYRILAPGGTLLIADVLALSELDESLKRDPSAWAFCVAGALSPGEWEQKLEAAGFCGVEIQVKETFSPLGRGLVKAVKP